MAMHEFRKTVVAWTFFFASIIPIELGRTFYTFQIARIRFSFDTSSRFNNEDG